MTDRADVLGRKREALLKKIDGSAASQEKPFALGEDARAPLSPGVQHKTRGRRLQVP